MVHAQLRSQEVFSFTSDLGTESVLPRVGPADMAAAFPHWVDIEVGEDTGLACSPAREAPAGAADLDLMIMDDGAVLPSPADSFNVDDMSVVDDDGAAADPARRLFDFEEDADDSIWKQPVGPPAAAAAAADLHFDIVDDTGITAAQAASHEQPPPPPPPDRITAEQRERVTSKGFFGGSLGIAGVLHICNNALNDVVGSLEHADWFFNRVKPLVRMLVDGWTNKNGSWNAASIRRRLGSITSLCWRWT